MTTKKAFDITVSALRKDGFNTDEILEVLRSLSVPMQDLTKKINPHQVSDKVNEGKVHKKEKKELTEEEKIHKIKMLFREIGIPCNLNGYWYLITGIILYEKNPLQPVTKELYPMIAKKYGTTLSRVERSMRHAIGSACKCTDNEAMNKFLGNAILKNRNIPTNTEFLATCAEWLNG